MAVFRPDPALGVRQYKTYQIRQPVSTHFRPATCTEVDCQAQAHGWRTMVDERTPTGQAQAHYIRAESRRKFREHRDETGLTVFTFDAGQKCFAEHAVSLDRPQIFLVRDGDFRGNPTGRKLTHRNGQDWVDDFGEHQARLAEQIEKG